MKRTSVALACLTIALAVSCGEERPIPNTEFDPNVPPTIPTQTRPMPGFEGPKSAADPSNPAAAAPPAVAAPNDPQSAPPVPKLLSQERLHFIAAPLANAPVAGDRVDIIGLFPLHQISPPSPEAEGQVEQQWVSMNLLQNARVHAASARADGYVDVGLALSMEETKLMLATAKAGRTVLTTRAAGDVEVNVVTKLTFREVVEDLEHIQEKRQIRRGRRTNPGSAALLRGERHLTLTSDLPPGAVSRGDAVDVMGTFPTSDSHAEWVAMPLLQAVRVTGVGSDWLGLGVTDLEAQMLLLAQTRGDLTFAVRNPADTDVSLFTRKTTREVLEDLEIIQEKRQIRIRRPRKKAMPEPAGIEIITGDGAGGGGGGGGVASSPSRGASLNFVSREKYDNPGQNHFVLTQEDALSTFAADVDTGSYTIARSKYAAGEVPSIDSVRPEEWVNYFDYGYQQPAEGPFAVSIEAAPSPFQTHPKFRLLRIGVQTKAPDANARKPLHLTFLVDVSGSMSSPDKIGLVQYALRYLVGAMRPEDTVAIATYAGATRRLLAPTPVSKRSEILEGISGLTTGGGTAMNDGLAIAYALADEGFVAGHENRVIVLSDGDANVGRTGVNAMLATIAAGAARGITMTTIGVGSGNYNDAAMEQLANKGDGNYYYIDNRAEAKRVFGENLDGTLRTVARDVKLQVEFDPAAVARYRLIGYENRDVADADFRNDAVDAGEIGAGHSVTALYELEVTNPTAETIATVRIRHRAPDDLGPTLQTEAVFGGANMASSLSRTSYSFQFAAAVAAFAEITRASPYAAHLNYDWVAEVAKGAARGLADREEFLQMLSRARGIGQL